MKKKKKQKNSSKSENTNLAVDHSENIDLDNTSFISDRSLQCSHLSVVLHPKFSTQNSECSRWAKSNWRNIILLHPTVLLNYSIHKYALVRGQSNCTLCVVYPLKNLKKSHVVFLKDCLGFRHEEAVTLHPYEQKINTAAEICISFNSGPPSGIPELSDFILAILSNRFICSSMKLECKISGCKFQFTITKVLAKEEQCLAFEYDSSLNGICDIGNLSLENSSHLSMSTCAISSKSQRDKINAATTKSNATFSFVDHCSKSDEILQICELSKNFNDSNLGDSFGTNSTPYYFTVSHETVLNISPGPENEMSSLHFGHIGGLKKQLNVIETHMNMFLNGRENYKGGFLLLLGPSGTGKSLVLKALSGQYNAYVENILWYDWTSKSLCEAKKELRCTFQKAIKRAPSIVVIDDFNMFCSSKRDGKNFHISRIFCELIEELHDHKIIVLAAADSADYDATVLKFGKTETEIIKFEIPTSADRFEILEKLLNACQHNLTAEEIEQCVNYSNGFTGKDLLNALDDAHILSSVRINKMILCNEDCKEVILQFGDIKQALMMKRPDIVQESNIKVKKVFWSDIGGMHDVKEKLIQLVEWPFKYPEIFKRFHITPSRGILMYGPPGCSKTLIAKALATECNMNFISKNASDLFNKWVGESEKAVRDMFALARSRSPCIIFLDEIDALVSERESCSGGSGVGNRIITTFLTEIDGIEELHNVIIIAATNRPDMLDDALMRNGRISHFIYVPLPDIAAREEILKLQMKKRSVAEDLDFKHLALITEGYTGAEIVNICNEAALILLTEDLKADSPIFTLTHFEKALEAVLPRTSKDMIDFYANFSSTKK